MKPLSSLPHKKSRSKSRSSASTQAQHPLAHPLTRDTRLVLSLLEKIQGGSVDLYFGETDVETEGQAIRLGQGEPVFPLYVRHERMFKQILAKGDIGLAEAYLAGDWDAPDCAGLLCLLAKNRKVLKKAVYGAWYKLLSARCRHWLNGNSRRGSRRNILAHYDLGNAFYRAWLDPSMSYSSALYQTLNEEAKNASLEQAQQEKYRRILERLAAKPEQRILEIGCGWGGFAERAVAQGLRLTGLTLSPAQLDWARKRVPVADLRLQDYRDLALSIEQKKTEAFDHIVSIEMFEAVGEAWWPSYFKTLAQALKPGGRALIQSIVIDDALFPAYRRGTDFIQQYIFPGGMLPSRKAFRTAAKKQGLSVHGEYSFGRDYARTLALWRGRFIEHWPQIRELGFDEHFRRLWLFYLNYCEAGFLAGNVDVVQFELAH
ncbi:MAG: cyclopropane-fatty-acyl-phospholipid synthase family protein [Pseudomonadota bacterium]